MKPRHLSRRHRNDLVFRAAQILRLEQIARGEAEPENLRETCFLQMLKNGGGHALRDFVLSPILFCIECQQTAMDAGEAD